MTIAEKIKEERMRQKLSQDQFAQILGVTKQAVCNWELGISKPNDAMRIRLHEEFGFPYSVFFTE